MTIPTLGYASRTDAVLALSRDGLGVDEIARRIGIERDTVYAHLAAGRGRGEPRLARDTPSQTSISINRCVLAALLPAAAARGLTPSVLARRLLAAIAADHLVDAVLDDGAAVSGPPKRQKDDSA